MKKNCSELEKIESRLAGGARRRFAVQAKKALFSSLRFCSLSIAKIIELALASFFFIACSLPLLFCFLARRLFTRKAVFDRRDVWGQFGRRVVVRYFNTERPVLRHAFLFFHVLTFDLALIGVSIKPYIRTERVAGDACLFERRPGIFNLWFLRSSSRVAHAGRHAIELEYNFRRDFLGDLALVLKSLPAALFHVKADAYPATVNLFGVSFLNLTMQEALCKLMADIDAARRKKVYFVNPACFNQTFSNRKYFAVLKKADYIFPDGIGVLLACKMIKRPLRENINGTDMLPFLCRLAVEQNRSLFLLGGKPGIAAMMKRKLEDAFPGVRIVGERHGYFDSGNTETDAINHINQVKPDILLVALGVPRQELWIHRHSRSLDARVIMGVGGLFDFYSGNIRRAPQWMRDIGIEWTFRLWMEPTRMFKRYVIGNPLFIMRVLRWKKSGVDHG